MARPTHTLAVTAADVEAAAARIAGSVERTPTAHSVTLSTITGADVYVKFENFQFTASFKDRGARNKLLTLTADERARGVVAMSAGNHAQALAHQATLLGIPATIVMPVWTPQVKVHRTAMLGARVVLEGHDLKEAAAKAHALEHDEGLVFVSPYDDAAIIAGAGTVAIELLEDAPQVDMLVVPVGGGGLISGMAVATRARRPDVEIIGVEADRFPSMANAVHGEHAPVGGTTVAEGIAVPVAGTLTVPIVEALVSDVITVGEDSLEEAIDLFLEIEKVVAEGAGGAGLAALLEHPHLFRGRSVGIVLTGGNIDPRVLATILLRGLVRSGRLARLRVEISDVPGALGKVSSIVGEGGGNIVEVAHQRLFSDVSIKSAILELAVETRDRVHAEQLIAALDRGGFPTELLGATVRDDPTGHLEG
jgi:threonine dehydratase